MQAKALLAALLIAALPAVARQPMPAATDAQASVPPARYESAFPTYAPYEEPQIVPWRDVNDEVARAGGHVRIMGGAAGHGRDDTKKTPAPAAHKH